MDQVSVVVTASWAMNMWLGLCLDGDANGFAAWGGLRRWGMAVPMVVAVVVPTTWAVNMSRLAMCRVGATMFRMSV